MVDVKLYLFVILLVGILLVVIRLNTFCMFIMHLNFLFYEAPGQVIFPFSIGFLKLKKKEFLMYVYYVYDL